MIKKILITKMLLMSFLSFAQNSIPNVFMRDLPELRITDDVSLHIISPEPIQFVDISTDKLIGDLPTENIARIKLAPKEEEYAIENILGVLTVVGQSFMVQYRIVKNQKTANESTITNIQIQPNDMQALEYPDIKISNYELKEFAVHILKQRKDKRPLRKEKGFKTEVKLRNIYVVDDYFFLDLEIKNKSNLSYSLENIKFSIEDKRIYKATNNQSIEIKPVYQLYNQKQFKKNFRNIYVFKKFTFPNSKVMSIKLIEEPITGRNLELKVKYSDVLKADTL